MNDWERQLQEMNAREDAQGRRAVAEYERRRRSRWRAAIFVSILIVFVGVVAIIAILSGRDTENGASPDSDSHRRPGFFGIFDREDDGDGPLDPEIPDWITQDLLPVNDYSRPGTALEEVNGVVVHYVGNPGTTAQQNRNYFANLAETHETSASSHFVIGLDGEIIQCVPLTEISYCSNNRNSDTIAIECCHPDESGEFTDETVDSLVKLLRWLADTYGLTSQDIIRHYDVTGKICPKYYVDNPEEWELLKDEVFKED